MSSNGHPWTTNDIPDQRGRIAVITGANSGIGFETAKTLAQRHATVVLACRDSERAHQAAQRIRDEVSEAAVEVVRLDLNSLAAVRDAADEIRDRFDHIDLLFNNAGIMWTPRARTVDGYDQQLAVNHLGHFALTGMLLDRITAVNDARIITVTSLLHRTGRIHFADLHFNHGYTRSKAYSQSKLANAMFTYGLQEHLNAAESAVMSVAAHPGASNTGLLRHLPSLVRPIATASVRAMFQDAAAGALPSLRAATDPHVTGGQCFGPDGFAQGSGNPVPVRTSSRSHSRSGQRLLWQASEQLTEVSYKS